MTPWTLASQAPLSVEFSRHEYWNRFLFPPAGCLPDPGTKPSSPASAGGFFSTEPPGEAQERQVASQKSKTAWGKCLRDGTNNMRKFEKKQNFGKVDYKRGMEEFSNFIRKMLFRHMESRL